MRCAKCGAEIMDFTTTCFKCNATLKPSNEAVSITNTCKPKLSKIIVFSCYIMGAVFPLLGLIFGTCWFVLEDMKDDSVLMMYWTVFWCIVHFLVLVIL